MRIGIDIDDTITDSYEPLFAYAQEYTLNELKRSPKPLKNFSEHHSYLRDMHGWSKEEETKFWDTYFKKALWEIKPFTLAKETINKLKDNGNEIVIITARWDVKDVDSKNATLKWLDSNGIKYDSFYSNVSDKSKVACEEKLDLFIDDSCRSCTSVSEKGIKTFLMDTRTNKGFESDKITRVYSWSDIYDKINKLEKGII